MSDQVLKTLGHKLGITLPNTYRKATELQRLLSTKGVKVPSSSCEAVICLQLAAILTGDTCDKTSTARLSGLAASKYRSQYQALSRVLGVEQRVTIHDLSISHGAMIAEPLAKDLLHQYTLEVKGVDADLPLFQCAALYSACKQMKVKLDKKKLIDTSGAQKKIFDNLVEKLVPIAAKVAEKKPKKVDTPKSKRTKTLMDLVEDNISAALTSDSENNKRKSQDQMEKRKSAKSEKEIKDEEYELWKKKILEEAQNAE